MMSKYEIGDYVKFGDNPIDPTCIIYGEIVGIIDQDNAGWFDYKIKCNGWCHIQIVSQQYIIGKVNTNG